MEVRARTGRLFLLAVLAIAASCAAGSKPARGPYLQQTTSHGVVVAWRTAHPTTTTVAWGEDPSRLTRQAGSGARAVDHAVRIDGLDASTRYYYSIDREPRADAAHSFRTAPAPGSREPFRFWVVGDSGTGGPMEREVRDSMLEATRTRPIDFAIHVGDLAYPSGTEEQLHQGFFVPYAAILKTVSFWPALGNHEAEAVDATAQSGPWFDAFVLPTRGETGGAPSGTEAWYAFDWGNAHFVVLDSSLSSRAPDGPMLRWLEADLAAADADWLIAVWHHAPYSASIDGTEKDANSLEMRANVVPILERAGVDLVLAGHSHAYTRSFLIDGAEDDLGDPSAWRLTSEPPSRGQALEKRAGPHGGAVYVIAGHGGAEPDDVVPGPTVAVVDAGHGSCIVDVVGDELQLVDVLASGAIGDSFTLVKRRR